MNFEVGEKRARMAAARLRGSARGCGARVRSSAAGDRGLARQVELRVGSSGERPGGGGRGELSLLYQESPPRNFTGDCVPSSSQTRVH